MLNVIQKLIKDKGGGTFVPVIFPLIALILSVAIFFLPIIITYNAWEYVKISAFIILLILASIEDLKNMEVPHRYWILMLVVGLINVSWDSLIGLVVCFTIFFIVAMLTNLGGADVKIAGACGFVMGTIPCLFALVIGLFISVIVEQIITAIKNNGIKHKYPLVPYMAIGCIIITILKGFILWN